jgi:hypothetical protein
MFYKMYLTSAMVIAIQCLTATAGMAGPMTSEELTTLYANDVTECGKYPKDGKLIAYCEYYRKDGTIAGKDRMRYFGKYHIDVERGVLCVKYGSGIDDCGTLQHKSGDVYNTFFSDGSRGDVTIVKGNSENFK